VSFAIFFTAILFIYFFQYGVAGDYYFFAYSYMVRAYLTECKPEAISLKSKPVNLIS